MTQDAPQGATATRQNKSQACVMLSGAPMSMHLTNGMTHSCYHSSIQSS